VNLHVLIIFLVYVMKLTIYLPKHWKAQKCHSPEQSSECKVKIVKEVDNHLILNE